MEVLDFEDFTRRRGRRLLQLAYLLTGTRQDAEDLAQEALVRLHRRWDVAGRTQDPFAYARKVLLNKFRSDIRRSAAVAEPLHEDVASLPDVDCFDALADRDRLQTALRGLPPRQREAVVLRYFEELSTDEISALMGIRASAVRSTVSRGLVTLRLLLLESDSEKEQDEPIRQ